MSDDRLIREAQSGDRKALEDLCRREWRPVYALLYASLGNRPETEDATQEVFLRALRSFDSYRHRDTPFRAYLVTIAKNLLRDRWRRSNPLLVDIAEQPEQRASDPSPDERIVDAEQQESLQSLISTLNEDQRDVVRLRILEGRSTEEVAGMMGRTPNAIRQLQYRALTTLRQRIREGIQL
jgi:RNA polymerase sigma-70 factor, ECF subfamily